VNKATLLRQAILLLSIAGKTPPEISALTSRSLRSVMSIITLELELGNGKEK
jgi:hypothetical protein